MITIEQIAEKVIERLKAFPEEAKQSTGEDSPKTVWDEYKEQVQFEEYDSFEVLQETIDSMVQDELNELSSERIRTLFNSIYEDYQTDDLEEMLQDVNDEILSNIHNEAESGEIEYSDSEIKFYSYFLHPSDFPIEEIIEYNLVAVCEVIKRISPYEHLIHAYSNFTGPRGEQGVVNLSSLEEESGLEKITFSEFQGIKRRLFGEVKSSNGEIESEDAINLKTNHSGVILHQFKSPKINIRVEAYFEDETLFIKDSSVGENVENWFGGSEYEYILEVPSDEVKKMYPIFKLNDNNKEGLLRAVAERFNTKSCASELRDFMKANDINFEVDTWFDFD